MRYKPHIISNLICIYFLAVFQFFSNMVQKFCLMFWKWTHWKVGNVQDCTVSLRLFKKTRIRFSLSVSLSKSDTAGLVGFFASFWCACFSYLQCLHNIYGVFGDRFCHVCVFNGRFCAYQEENSCALVIVGKIRLEMKIYCKELVTFLIEWDFNSNIRVL